MIIQSIDRNGTSATWRLLRRRNPQVFSDYFSFSAFTKIFSTLASEESFLLPFIVSFHQDLYTNWRGRDCTENLWTILPFMSLLVCPMQQKTKTMEKYCFTKFFVNLTKSLKLKTRYAGNPRKMPETVSSGEDSFASRCQVAQNHIDWDGDQDDIDWLMIMKRCWLHCNTFTIKPWRLPHYNSEKSKYLFFFAKSNFFFTQAICWIKQHSCSKQFTGIPGDPIHDNSKSIIHIHNYL